MHGWQAVFFASCSVARIAYDGDTMNSRVTVGQVFIAAFSSTTEAVPRLGHTSPFSHA